MEILHQIYKPLPSKFYSLTCSTSSCLRNRRAVSQMLSQSNAYIEEESVGYKQDEKVGVCYEQHEIERRTPQVTVTEWWRRFDPLKDEDISSDEEWLAEYE